MKSPCFIGLLSRQNIVNDVTMYISQPIPPTLQFISESLVIDTQEMHQSSLKIVDMNGVFSYIVAKIIGFAVCYSFFHPCTRHPDTKAFGVMIPAIIVFGQFPLRIICPAKFSAPDDQSIL